MKERCLDKRKQRGRRDGCHREILGCAVVEHVAVDLRIGHVEARRELVDDIDVCVEAHVQAIEVVFASCALRVGVAEREVVHTHVVATLHIDAVVLRDSRVIDFLRPVGVVVVFPVVVFARIVVEELKVFLIIANLGMGSEHFRGVESVLRSGHHLRQPSDERHAGTDVGIDFRYQRVTALCGDKHHAVAALRSVECRCVLQHLHFFDVGRIDVEQQVGVVAVVKRTARFLHVADDAIDHDERHGIGIERVQSANEHG